MLRLVKGSIDFFKVMVKKKVSNDAAIQAEALHTTPTDPFPDPRQVGFEC